VPFNGIGNHFKLAQTVTAGRDLFARIGQIGQPPAGRVAALDAPLGTDRFQQIGETIGIWHVITRSLRF
jgi:hypothetical protein